MAKNLSSYQQAGQGEISSCHISLSQAGSGLQRLCNLQLHKPRARWQARTRKTQGWSHPHSSNPVLCFSWGRDFESRLGLDDR